MHRELWAGVALKLNNARFHFENMGRALDPPERTHMNVVLQSAGTIIDTDWHRRFHAHLDAFLSATRSVAEIINCCFGYDQHWQLKTWFSRLPDNEKDRRRQFSELFRNRHNCFAHLPLSTARHISEHRTGYPDVTVAINGMFGVTYIGSPTNPVPLAETRKIDDPERAFLARPHQLYPVWTDFKIDGQGLFEACDTYLQCAQELINVAQGIAQQVHGDKTLTAPDRDLS